MQTVCAGVSRPVRSSQHGIHPRLEAVVRKHVAAPWLKPPHGPSLAAFERLSEMLADHPCTALILDAGCGTGESTRALAKKHPGATVIGVDRSEGRLARTGHRRWPAREGRIVFVRAELATFWRLAQASDWRLEAHYLLYPNPWPKPGQLQRRWHAHPVFPHLLALGGELVMRCNWSVYAEEFARAARCLIPDDVRVERLSVAEALSPFERKYAASGHELFEVRVPAGSGTRM